MHTRGLCKCARRSFVRRHGESAGYNRPPLHLSKFFIKRRVLIKNVQTGRLPDRRSLRGQISQYYTILKNADCLSQCANTHTHPSKLIPARRFVFHTHTRDNPPLKRYIRDYNCASYFALARNRDDAMIMNFPPRRLLEIQRIDTLSQRIDTSR